MPLPDEDAQLDPDIEREMTVPPLHLPKFSPHIKEEDLEDFVERDKKMLLALSLVEQKQDFALEAAVLTNRQLRHVESELIRLRKTQSGLSFQGKVLKWTGVTAGAGLLAAMFKKAADVIWK